jgi:hypothetical protein
MDIFFYINVIIDYQVLVSDYECGFDYRDDLSGGMFKISRLKIRKEKFLKKKIY